jgi:hypothetical protein
MALQASALPREFFYKGSRIPCHRKRIYCLRGISDG